jgi:hypothetical protein
VRDAAASACERYSNIGSCPHVAPDPSRAISPVSAVAPELRRLGVVDLPSGVVTVQPKAG